jgi:hypothetical protein
MSEDILHSIQPTIPQRLKAERDEARLIVLEMFRRDCALWPYGDDKIAWRYDHMCSATYEEAQNQLIAWGMVKPEECVRP